MSYVNSAIAILVGTILLLYCLHGLCDPYWGRSVRVMSAIGAVVGLATIFLTMWSM